MNFSLRKVLLEDINELSSMHIQAWKDAYQNIIDQEYLNNLKLQDKISTWQKVLSNEKSGYNLLACNDKNKILGFASAGAHRDDPSFGEIFAIYVRANSYGHGIGQSLWKNMNIYLKENNFTHAKLWVLENNKKAIDFYTKNKCTFTNEKKKIMLGNKEYAELSFVWKVEIENIHCADNKL
ncbi:GNAT family N-acetyltransferase [Fluviispira vulneris]|uniref:GNAT family N-acetyltransferase n=1 Tax=Fluviispira vulneris TaxID=2763012 RepID=UPI00164661D8|nr:GNAT family N-acetyltransferase [Fluviispira vulneris]